MTDSSKSIGTSTVVIGQRPQLLLKNIPQSVEGRAISLPGCHRAGSGRETPRRQIEELFHLEEVRRVAKNVKAEDIAPHLNHLAMGWAYYGPQAAWSLPKVCMWPTECFHELQHLRRYFVAVLGAINKSLHSIQFTVLCRHNNRQLCLFQLL